MAKRPGETDQQWKTRVALARVVNPEQENREVANDFAQQHGDYSQRFVMHVETGTRARAHVNRGGTPICRWHAAKKLTDDQLAFIHKCQRLWWVAGGNPRVTATYGERLGGAGDAAALASAAADAREDINRISGYFPGPLKAYWDVFENVCRHSLPAGVAGAGMGYEGKAAANRAHLIVCFVADYVNTREPL